MTLTISMNSRNDRNGAAASQWAKQQPYDPDLAARDPKTPEHIMLTIAENGTSRSILSLASNTGSSKAVLDKIYETLKTDQSVRRLAGNANASSELLRILATNHYNHMNSNVLERIAKNKNTPADVLVPLLPSSQTKFAWGGDAKVQLSVLSNLNTPVEELLFSLRFLKEDSTKEKLFAKRASFFLDILSHVSGNIVGDLAWKDFYQAVELHYQANHK